VNYSCQVSDGAAAVTSTVERNAYQPWWKSAEVTIYGVVAPKEVHIGERSIHEWRYDDRARAVTLTVPDALKNWSVRLVF
jgi:hypothetical protein